MTANEARYQFLLLYNKLASNASPGYIDREISELFNIAYRELIRNTYSSEQDRPGFEGDELTRKDLSPLVIPVTLTTNTAGFHPNSQMYTLPTDCLFVLEEQAVLASSNSCKNGRRASVLPMKLDDYTSNINNPFKKPHEELVWRLDMRDRHELLTDGTFTVNMYNIVYLKRPAKVVVDISTPANQVNFELDDEAVMKIIRTAVRIAKGAVEIQGYEVSRIEELTSR